MTGGRIVFFLFLTHGLGNSSQTLLEIRDLKSSYPAGGPVAFALISSSEKPLFYGVGVEQRTEAGWREIVPNIEAVTYSPAYQYHRLAPHGTRHLVWNVKVSVPGIPVTSGVYRFFIAFEKPKGEFARAYSQTFSLR
jgi:hypothetical protein